MSLTQKVFKDAHPDVKSAVMDAEGRVWLFECKKKHLSPNHRSWVSDIETAFYYADTAPAWLDVSNWQNSAIDRDKSA